LYKFRPTPNTRKEADLANHDVSVVPRNSSQNPTRRHKWVLNLGRKAAAKNTANNGEILIDMMLIAHMLFQLLLLVSLGKLCRLGFARRLLVALCDFQVVQRGQ